MGAHSPRPGQTGRTTTHRTLSSSQCPSLEDPDTIRKCLTPKHLNLCLCGTSFLTGSLQEDSRSLAGSTWRLGYGRMGRDIRRESGKGQEMGWEWVHLGSPPAPALCHVLPTLSLFPLWWVISCVNLTRAGKNKIPECVCESVSRRASTWTGSLSKSDGPPQWGWPSPVHWASEKNKMGEEGWLLSAELGRLSTSSCTRASGLLVLRPPGLDCPSWPPWPCETPPPRKCLLYMSTCAPGADSAEPWLNNDTAVLPLTTPLPYIFSGSVWLHQNSLQASEEKTYKTEL